MWADGANVSTFPAQAEKTETSASVYKFLNDSLIKELPYPIYVETDNDLKTNLV